MTTFSQPMNPLRPLAVDPPFRINIDCWFGRGPRAPSENAGVSIRAVGGGSGVGTLKFCERDRKHRGERVRGQREHGKDSLFVFLVCILPREYLPKNPLPRVDCTLRKVAELFGHLRSSRECRLESQSARQRKRGTEEIVCAVERRGDKYWLCRWFAKEECRCLFIGVVVSQRWRVVLREEVGAHWWCEDLYSGHVRWIRNRDRPTFEVSCKLPWEGRECVERRKDRGRQLVCRRYDQLPFNKPVVTRESSPRIPENSVK